MSRTKWSPARAANQPSKGKRAQQPSGLLALPVRAVLTAATSSTHSAPCRRLGLDLLHLFHRWCQVGTSGQGRVP